MATFADHQDELWEVKQNIDMPRVEIGPQWSEPEYVDRMVRTKVTVSALQEGFPWDQVVDPAGGDANSETSEVEARNCVKILVLIDGDVEGGKLAAVARSTSINTLSRQAMKDSAIHDLTSAVPAFFIGQYVDGKVETYDAFVHLWGIAREVKKQELIAAGQAAGSPERIQTEALITYLRNHLAAERGRLVAHFDQFAEEVRQGRRDAYWSKTTHPDEDVAHELTTRTIRYLQSLSQKAATPFAFEAQPIHMEDQLPQQRYKYHELGRASRLQIWYNLFPFVVYQIFASLGGLINLRDTLQDPGWHEFLKFRWACMADAVAKNILAPAVEKLRATSLIDDFE